MMRMRRPRRSKEAKLLDSAAPSLVCTAGPAAGSRFFLTSARTTIGRDADCDILLIGNTISRVHATVHRSETGVVSIVDADSANGVYVNDARVQKAILEHGDELKLGNTIFRIDCG